MTSQVYLDVSLIEISQVTEGWFLQETGCQQEADVISFNCKILNLLCT